MRFVIISTSLNPSSKSAMLAGVFESQLRARDSSVTTFDLRKHALPGCDGVSCFDNDAVRALRSHVEQADGVIILAPIYSWSIAASTKNTVELVGSAFRCKVVALAAVSGSPRAFLAPLELLTGLMVDHQSFLVPKYAVIDAAGFEDDEPTDDTKSRIQEIALILFQMSNQLRTWSDVGF